MSDITLALFPLSAHILPNGRMALRIFEQRYVRMVKEACAEKRQFGICMLDPNGDKEQNLHIFPVGTLVKVVDFNILEDGLLGIVVEGIRTFEITTIKSENDGLRVGNCQWVSAWSQNQDQQKVSPLNDKLETLFTRFEEFKQLYPSPKFDDPQWVLFRWLELLPVAAKQKQSILKRQDWQELHQFISELVQ